MRFYDNQNNLHKSYAGAVIANVKNSIGSKIKPKKKEVPVYEDVNSPDEVIDGGDVIVVHFADEAEPEVEDTAPEEESIDPTQMEPGEEAPPVEESAFDQIPPGWDVHENAKQD